MEQDKTTCTRCYKKREISFFRTIDGKPRRTCNDCRKYSATHEAKRRGTKVDSLEEIEKSELEGKIRSVLLQKENEVDNNTQGIQLRCILKTEEFEKDNEEVAKSVAAFIQQCDGYTYK